MLTHLNISQTKISDEMNRIVEFMKMYGCHRFDEILLEVEDADPVLEGELLYLTSG